MTRPAQVPEITVVQDLEDGLFRVMATSYGMTAPAGYPVCLTREAAEKIAGEVREMLERQRTRKRGDKEPVDMSDPVWRV